MNDTDAGADRCAGPGCYRPLVQPPVGRRKKYCGGNCKKAAQRAKAYAARDAAERAAQLQAARDEMARLWRPLEQEGTAEVAEAAARVFTAVGSGGDVDETVADLRRHVDRLAHLARGYRDASERADRLSQPARAGHGLA